MSLTDTQMAPNAKRFSVLHWLLVLLPGAITCVVLAIYGTAKPMLDDFTDILAFASQLHDTPGWAGKLHAVVFTQAGGVYKLGFLQALIALQLGTLGHLNFPMLLFIGNASLYGIFVLLILNTDIVTMPRNEAVLRLLPVSLLLFGLNYAETVDWALCSLQQLSCAFFSLAAFHFLTRSRSTYGTFAAACIFTVLAAFSNAVGLLVLPVGLLYLLLRRSYAVSPASGGGRTPGWMLQIALWIALFIAIPAIYFSHYTRLGLMANASIALKALFFVMFCGGSFENMHHRPIPYVSVAVGLFVLTTLAAALLHRYDRSRPFFFFTGVWLLGCAALTANTRVAMGLDVSLSGRYKLYCVLLLIVCYEYLLDRYLLRPRQAAPANEQSLRRFLRVATAVTALLFCGSEVTGMKFLKTRHDRAEKAWGGYLSSGRALSPMFLVSENLSVAELAMEEACRKITNDAVDRGVYVLPSR